MAGPVDGVLAGARDAGCTAVLLAARLVELQAALQLVEGPEQVWSARPVESWAALLLERQVEQRLVERREVAGLAEPLAALQAMPLGVLPAEPRAIPQLVEEPESARAEQLVEPRAARLDEGQVPPTALSTHADQTYGQRSLVVRGVQPELGLDLRPLDEAVLVARDSRRRGTGSQGHRHRQTRR